MNLYVGNLSKELDSLAVKCIFSKFGSCNLSYFVNSTQTTFAFIEFEDRSEAEHALKTLDGTCFGGQSMKIEQAKVRPTLLKCLTCDQEGHTSADHKGRSRSRSPNRLQVKPDSHGAVGECKSDDPEPETKEQRTTVDEATALTESDAEMQTSTEDINSHGASEQTPCVETSSELEGNSLATVSPSKGSTSELPDATKQEGLQAATSPEESKELVATAQKIKGSARSRSPRSKVEREIVAVDGTKFKLIKVERSDMRTSRYRCLACNIEMQRKSIVAHVKAKAHQDQL
jgi:RNA recognition motif-containing protein